MDDGVGRGTVLVVEDEYLLAIEIEANLRELGFNPVFLASSLDEGRNYLRSHSLRLAVLDVNVGSELVFPLATDVAVMGIPIIFSTAWPAHEFPIEWAHYPILQKPWLTATLKRVLDARGGGVDALSPSAVIASRTGQRSANLSP